MGNARSLTNKIDELTTVTHSQHEYRECGLLCFTEIWLTGSMPDCLIELDGFTLVRADRGQQSSKKKGGGLTIFVNSEWCNPGHVTVILNICTSDIELMAVGLRPYYLQHRCCCLHPSISDCSKILWCLLLYYSKITDTTPQCFLDNQWGLQPFPYLKYSPSSQSMCNANKEE